MLSEIIAYSFGRHRATKKIARQLEAAQEDEELLSRHPNYPIHGSLGAIIYWHLTGENIYGR